MLIVFVFIAVIVVFGAIKAARVRKRRRERVARVELAAPRSPPTMSPSRPTPCGPPRRGCTSARHGLDGRDPTRSPATSGPIC